MIRASWYDRGLSSKHLYSAKSSRGGSICLACHRCKRNTDEWKTVMLWSVFQVGVDKVFDVANVAVGVSFNLSNQSVMSPKATLMNFYCTWNNCWGNRLYWTEYQQSGFKSMFRSRDLTCSSSKLAKCHFIRQNTQITSLPLPRLVSLLMFNALVQMRTK